jgi:hypothetical protein
MFRELAKRAKRINIEQLALSVAKSNSGLIADNIREQLSVGKAGDNAAVGVYSSLPYANRKARISKAPFGSVDLKLSGRLYDEIFVDLSLNKVETGSKVDYSKYQVKRYGQRVYENTPENSGKVRDRNSRDIARNYSKALGL